MAIDILILTPSERDSLSYAAPETELAKAVKAHAVVLVRDNDHIVEFIKGYITPTEQQRLEQKWADEEEAARPAVYPDEEVEESGELFDPDITDSAYSKTVSARNDDSVISPDGEEEGAGGAADPFPSTQEMRDALLEEDSGRNVGPGRGFAARSKPTNVAVNAGAGRLMRDPEKFRAWLDDMMADRFPSILERDKAFTACVAVAEGRMENTGWADRLGAGRLLAQYGAESRDTIISVAVPKQLKEPLTLNGIAPASTDEEDAAIFKRFPARSLEAAGHPDLIRIAKNLHEAQVEDHPDNTIKSWADLPVQNRYSYMRVALSRHLRLEMRLRHDRQANTVTGVLPVGSGEPSARGASHRREMQIGQKDLLMIHGRNLMPAVVSSLLKLERWREENPQFRQYQLSKGTDGATLPSQWHVILVEFASDAHEWNGGQWSVSGVELEVTVDRIFEEIKKTNG